MKSDKNNEIRSIPQEVIDNPDFQNDIYTI